MSASAAELSAVFADVDRRWPAATFVRNGLGNLVIVVGGVYVGWVDLMAAEVGEFGR